MKISKINFTERRTSANNNKTQSLATNPYLPQQNNNAPNFNGRGTFLQIFNNAVENVKILMEKDPIKKAENYIQKGNKTANGNEAAQHYIKAITTLHPLIESGNVRVQREFISTYFKLAECEASESTAKALTRYQELMHHLTEAKSPFAKDKNILITVISKVNSLGDNALENKNFNSAKNCYEYCRNLTLYAEDAVGRNITKGGKPLIRTLDKMISGLKTLNT